MAKEKLKTPLLYTEMAADAAVQRAIQGAIKNMKRHKGVQYGLSGL